MKQNKTTNETKQYQHYEVISIKELRELLNKAEKKSIAQHGKIETFSTICLHYKDVGFETDNGTQLFLYEVI